MKYSMNDERISYMGRIDISEEERPIMYYAASRFSINFKGTGVSVSFINRTVWGNVSLGYVIDGRMGKLPLNISDNDKEITLQVCGSLSADEEHTLTVYKRLSANHSVCFTGLEIENGGLLENYPDYDMKLEFYGDSVTAGEVSEAVDFVGLPDPVNHGSVYDNSWYSFAAKTAKILNAEANMIAQGGIAVFDGTGYFHAPDFIGMESVYDKLPYFPEAMRHKDTPEKWDFSRYTPDVVIIALGQNDNHDGKTDKCDIDINNESTRAKWKNGYKKIVRDLSDKYGADVKFVLTTTVLRHDKSWDDAIEEIKDELLEEGIQAYHNMFSRNGAATDGHPRIPEHIEMAQELADFINSELY